MTCDMLRFSNHASYRHVAVTGTIAGGLSRCTFSATGCQGDLRARKPLLSAAQTALKLLVI